MEASLLLNVKKLRWIIIGLFFMTHVCVVIIIIEVTMESVEKKSTVSVVFIKSAPNTAECKILGVG
jgi:flagellar basal body-associated protein FliL